MTVRPRGEMTSNSATEIRNKLLPALQRCEPIELNAYAVTEIDVASLRAVWQSAEAWPNCW